jgi:nucleoside-diphosphate-sugar epimerase
VSRVAVTGAKGFIGAATCARLEADGHDVVEIDLPETDVTDLPALVRAFDGCDLVVHTVALLPDRGDMADHVRVNVGGTRNVLDAADTAGVGRVLHVSSVAAWGYEFDHDLDEDAPPRPCGNPYIDTKGTSELLARRRGATVVRPGDVYGPRSQPWAIRPVNALKSGMFALPAGGEGLVTPVYIDDLVDCFVRALTMPEADGQVFTCWDGNAVTARDFFGYHARWTGKTIHTAPTPLVMLGAAAGMLVARAQGKEPDASPASLQFISRKAAYPNTRAREVLGWEPKVSLDEGMRRVEEWLRGEALL